MYENAQGCPRFSPPGENCGPNTPVLASQRAWMSTILDYPTESSSDSRETDESSSITMYLVRVV